MEYGTLTALALASGSEEGRKESDEGKSVKERIEESESVCV